MSDKSKTSRQYHTLGDLLGANGEFRHQQALVNAQLGSDRAEGIRLPRYVYRSQDPTRDPRGPLEDR